MDKLRGGHLHPHAVCPPRSGAGSGRTDARVEEGPVWYPVGEGECGSGKDGGVRSGEGGWGVGETGE